MSQPDTVILLAAPSATDSYYAPIFDAAIDLDARMVAAAGPGEHVVVIANRTTIRRIGERIPADHLLEGRLADIWLRDVAPIRTPRGWMKCRFAPEYLEPSTSASIERCFMRWHDGIGLRARPTDLVLDGGNYVWDGAGQAILTERVLSDNPSLTRQDVLRVLQRRFGLERICLLPVEPGDRTGHSDGMAKWLLPTKVAVNRYPEPFRSRVLRCLEAAFPAIGIVELPYCLTGRKWRDWEDAAGIYTNALETAHTVFVPTYQMRADKQALALYRQHSAKRVVSIVASGVSVAGGSLHCLSWVLTGVGARAILGVSARTNRIPD